MKTLFENLKKEGCNGSEGNVIAAGAQDINGGDQDFRVAYSALCHGFNLPPEKRDFHGYERCFDIYALYASNNHIHP